ncbi:hypothetical protein Rs2_22219 [Raphanus sativus]|nr:hypothetical protein Rs2_22219 [Raphanus sativus]
MAQLQSNPTSTQDRTLVVMTRHEITRNKGKRTERTHVETSTKRSHASRIYTRLHRQDSPPEIANRRFTGTPKNAGNMKPDSFSFTIFAWTLFVGERRQGQSQERIQYHRSRYHLPHRFLPPRDPSIHRVLGRK